jgi:molecular chaperone GrpE
MKLWSDYMTGKRKKEEHSDSGKESVKEKVKTGETSQESIDGVETSESEDKLLKEAEEKIAVLNDKYARLVAEYDNYRKRASREMSEISRSTAEAIIRSLLPVLDSLDRATEHKNNEESLEEYIKGITLIENMIRDLLAQAGLKPMDAAGKPFDPNIHDAVLQIENKDYPPGTVVNELEKGYLLSERVLRHSKVIVSK